MYDDSITSSNNYSNIQRHAQHWYDEPPYESDPDDFLMSGNGAAATIQVGGEGHKGNNINYCYINIKPHTEVS